MEEGIKKPEENFDDLNIEIEDLLNEISQKEINYTSSVESLRKDIENKQLFIDELSCKLKDLKNLLLSRENELEKLKIEVNDLNSELNFAKTSIEEEKKKNIEFEILLKSSNSALKDKENELNKIWNMLEETKNELSIHKARIQEKENAIEILQRMNKKLESELQNITNSARQVEEGYQNKIELLKKEVAEKNKEIANLEDRIKTNSMDNLAKIIQEKDNFIRKLEDNLADLKKELESNKNRYIEVFEEKRNKEQELSFALIEKDKEIEDLKNQIACLKKESTELTEKWTFSSVQLQNVSSNLRAREGEIEILQGKIKTLENECQNYRQQVMSLKAQKILKSMSAVERQQESQKLQSMIEALRQETDKYNDLLNRYDALVLQMKNVETQKERLAANCERLSKENANLHRECENLARREQELLRLYEEKTYRLSSETLESAGKSSQDILKKIIEEKEALIKELKEQNAYLKKTEQEREHMYLNYVSESRNKEAELKSLIREKDDELIDLKNQIKCIKKDLADITEKWTFSSAQLQATSSNLRTKESEVEILEGRIKTLEKEVENYKRMSLKTQEVINSLSDYNEKQENEKILSLTNAIAHEHAKYNELLGQFEIINSQLKSLEEENIKIKINHEVLLKENNNLKNRYIELEKSKNEEIEKLNAQIMLLEKDFNRKMGDVIKREQMRHLEITKEMHDSTIMLKRKEAELEVLKDSLRTMQEEYDNLLRHEKEINEKYAREIAVENSALKEITANVELKDKQIKDLINIIESHKKEIAKYKQDYKVLKDERDRMLSSKTKSKKELTEKERRLKEYENNLKKKEEELNRTKTQLNKLKAEKLIWIEKEDEFKKNLSSKKLMSLVIDARNKLKEKEKEIVFLNIKLENLNKELNNFKKQQEEIQKSYPADLQELVFGISQQIFNSISIIKSHAEFCMEAPRNTDFKNSINAIIRNTLLLQKKVENILNFTNPVILQCKPIVLKDLIQDVIKSTRKRYNIEKIDIEVLEDRNIKPIKADWVKMQEALYQVLVNAIEAMPEGGKLKIEIKRDHTLENQIIRISDTGCGIEKKHLTSVFEPFFTTKSEKIGLGLSIARNIIKAHSGNIKITSESGKGTIVEITFPVS